MRIWGVLGVMAGTGLILAACGGEDAITRRLREHPEIKRDAQIKGAIESRTGKAVTLTHIVVATGPSGTIAPTTRQAVCGTAESEGTVFIFIKPDGWAATGDMTIFETWTFAVPSQLEAAGCSALLQFAPPEIRGADVVLTPGPPAARLSPEPVQ